MSNNFHDRMKMASLKRISEIMARQENGDFLDTILKDYGLKYGAFKVNLAKYNGRIVEGKVKCNIEAEEIYLITGERVQEAIQQKLLGAEEERFLEKLKSVATNNKLIVIIDDTQAYWKLQILAALEYINTELITTFTGRSKLLVEIIK